MVGVNALITSGTSDYHEKFSDAQNTMLHYPSYRANTLFEDSCMLIGSTAYEHYPITCFEDSASFIVLEGMIYNIDDATIRKDLFAIASEVHEGELFKETIARFLAHADGEFVVLIYNKQTRDLCVFNDALGRLPFFCYRDDEVLAFSREVKFIHPFIGQIAFNRLALMEYLLYGFALGERTLIEGVERLLPATLVTYRGLGHTLSKEQVLPLTFEPEEKDRKNPQENIQNLKRSFLEGLQNRVEKLGSKKPLISLSGGLDSRATLAGLTACGVKPRGITYDTAPENAPELEYTQKIADLFWVPLTHLTPSKEPDHEDYLRYVAMIDAAQPIGLANVVNIEEQIMLHEGSDVVYYTGLYGGELLRYLNVTSGLGSDDDLVQFLLTTPDQYRYAHEKVCAMLQIPEDEMQQHLRAHIATYPEKDPYTKYIHFKFEKDYKWAGPGEDRNRLFFWTITPFYSRGFFNTAYAIDEHEKNTFFFRNFLYALDPRTCIVGNYNTGMPLMNPLRLRIYGLAEKAVRNPWIRRLGSQAVHFKKGLGTPQRPDPEREKMRTMALDLLEESDLIKEYFSLPATGDVIRAEGDTNKLQRILTLFIYMDIIDRGGYNLCN
jgi:asparagine synthase (glutamine-hydrolysing)